MDRLCNLLSALFLPTSGSISAMKFAAHILLTLASHQFVKSDGRIINVLSCFAGFEEIPVQAVTKVCMVGVS